MQTQLVKIADVSAVAAWLRCSPMVGVFSVVQMSDARDQRGVAFTHCPLDRLFLGRECAEDMIGMVFDDIIVDCSSLLPAFGTCLNVNVSHVFSP